MQSDLDISAINNTTYIKTEINEEKQLKYKLWFYHLFI